MSKTTEDLKAAFSGESQASRKYWTWAKKADDEGYPQIAKLFRAAATAETTHAFNHLRALGQVLSTAETLQAAITGEDYEADSMSPEFIKEAEEEQVKKAVTSSPVSNGTYSLILTSNSDIFLKMEKLLRLSPIYDILQKAEYGKRLSFEDGVRLFKSNDILHIGHIANIVRERKNGNKAYFITNRHINYSNICKNRCKFCAFSKDKAESGSYEMALEEILENAMAAAEEGATELHIVGGLHPDLPFDFYVKMIREIHESCPDVHIQAFTAVEIEHLSQIARLSVHQTLQELKEAGLGSLPGGGAEVFSPKIREELCREKLSGEGWLQVMREAHTLGLRSNATMLYGHVETPEDRMWLNASEYVLRNMPCGITQHLITHYGDAPCPVRISLLTRLHSPIPAAGSRC